MKTISGLRNRLVRRLHVHANITGLFRFSETLQSGSASAGEPRVASAAEAARLPLAKAFLPFAEPIGEAGMVSPQNVFSAPETDGITSPAGKTDRAQSPDLQLAGSRPDAARIEAPAPVPSGNVFRATEPDRIDSPAAEENKKASEDDGGWHRLQNIFNKHRQKNTPQEAASLPGPQEAEASLPDFPAPATETAGETSAPIQSEMPADNGPGLPSVQMKRETAELPSVQRADNATPGISREIKFAPAEGQPASVEPASPVAASPVDVIQAASAGSLTTPLLPSTQADKVAPAPILSGETEELAQSDQPDKPLSQPTMEAPDPQATSLQSLPLEAVWAVERVRQPRSPLLPAPDEGDKLNFGGEETDRPRGSADVEQTLVHRAALQDDLVRSAIQDVQTAQTTGSGVEFIPPRRPRPVSAPVASNVPATERVRPPAETSQAAVQRRSEAGPQHEIVEPGVVPTEIGPLPEDLWNLVGAATPSIKNGAPPERPASGEILKWEEKSPLNNTSFPASQPGDTSQSPLVQRQANPPEGPAPASALPAAGKASVEEQAGEDMDIEELARQVYSELKHRLGLEWERLRRR